MVRIAVAGGTGLAGRHTVAALRQAGHDAVVLARSVGVDLTTGHGLADALVSVHAVIDVTNTRTSSPEQARAFFTTTTTRQLLAAEHHAGVGHHVVLSIVGIDRVKGNAHYAGKRAQERIVLAGPVVGCWPRETSRCGCSRAGAAGSGWSWPARSCCRDRMRRSHRPPSNLAGRPSAAGRHQPILHWPHRQRSRMMTAPSDDQAGRSTSTAGGNR